MLRELICHFIIKISKGENRSVTLKHSILIKNKYIIDLMHKKKKKGKQLILLNWLTALNY